MEIWPLLKGAVDWVIIPFAAVTWFFIQSHIKRVEAIERQGNENKEDIKVLKAQFLNLKEDIDEIKLGIHKLLERAYK